MVKNLSAPLYALMDNGHMKESRTKTATLEHVEASTFLGLCEFIYTGQYVTPTRKEYHDESLARLVDSMSLSPLNLEIGRRSLEKEEGDNDHFFNFLCEDDHFFHWEDFLRRKVF